MTRPRDNQRKRLYDAEDKIRTEKPWASMAECQEFVDRLESSRWFLARWRPLRPQLRDGRGYRIATAFSVLNVIQLPKWAREPIVILHEYAHLLTDRSAVGWSHGLDGHLGSECFAAHGPEFAGVFVVLVEHVMGPETAMALRDSFRRHRVRTSRVAVPSARYEIVSRASQVAAKRQTAQTAPGAAEMGRAADVLGRAIKAGVFGASDSKQRRAALAVARGLRT